MQVDADYPGGNIVVESTGDSEVALRQDDRDTEGGWFYWNFRLVGAAGREVTFKFMAGDVVGPLGPAMSLDRGLSWQWLGAEALTQGFPGFKLRIPATEEVRFAAIIPYVQSDLDRFLERHAGNKSLKVTLLAESEERRKIELIVIKEDSVSAPSLLFTCRHHACEAMASFVVEGIMETALGPEGAVLRKAGLAIVPFMDKDGVEKGDQGKNRRPYDHNRDYGPVSRYASVKALRSMVAGWPEGSLTVALDLHGPMLKGYSDCNHLHFAQPSDAGIRDRLKQFSERLESSQQGPLKFVSELPPSDPHEYDAYLAGLGGPSSPHWGPLFTVWAESLPGMRLAATLETPYALCGETTVTPDRARAFGRDLALALAKGDR